MKTKKLIARILGILLIVGVVGGLYTIVGIVSESWWKPIILFVGSVFVSALIIWIINNWNAK